MGFLDKAKVLAEQAQAKLDEVQGQFNERQKGEEPASSGPGYDKHGRPLAQDPQADAPGEPAAEPQTPADPEPERAATGPEAAEPPAGKPGAPKAAPGSGSGLSSGDPLGG